MVLIPTLSLNKKHKWEGQQRNLQQTITASASVKYKHKYMKSSNAFIPSFADTAAIPLG